MYDLVHKEIFCEIESKKAADLYGGIAQLGEHLLCKQGVRSSILLTSTKNSKREVIEHRE